MEKILKKIYLFKDLDDLEIMDLYDAIETKHYQQKTLIFQEGTKDNSFYFIKKGVINISKEKNKKHKIIAQLKKGDFFGELGALWGFHRTATASTQTESYLLKISGKNLEEIMDRNPPIGYKIMSLLAQELANRGQEYKQKITFLEDRYQGLEKKTNILIKELKKYNS